MLFMKNIFLYCFWKFLIPSVENVFISSKLLREGNFYTGYRMKFSLTGSSRWLLCKLNVIPNYINWNTIRKTCKTFRSSHRRFCFKKSYSEIFCNIHKKTPVLEYLFRKSCVLETCNFIKKRLWHSCLWILRVF